LSSGNTAGAHLNLVLNPLAGTPAQPADLIVADTGSHQAGVTTTQPVPSAQNVPVIRPGSGATKTLSADSFATTVPVSGEQPNTVVAHDMMVREIISPNDVIRAINGGNIALKFGNAGGEAAPTQIWLFDETSGDLMPPARQTLRIVLDHTDTSGMAEAAEQTAGLLATATMIASEPSWLGALRQIRRKAAGALLQATKWTG
jgi:hypothetical protein